ncbi:hypothetical protein WICPIJ_006484 [Wickerhamomyces pijperi]|uniref:SP-RING-type domain-containing protein n=1 Tax=Wickerhamomyces pijperi TaxID=599730 RepID=A0A9P8TK64_WICPI|nr:hypothetical protein WICPIJ_006484 [Wickerhamomyces pijperi]
MAETSVFSNVEYARVTSNITSFKVSQLKVVARGLSLAVTGRKADICDRILRYLQRLKETQEHAKLFAIRDLVSDAARGMDNLNIESYKHKYEGMVRSSNASKAARKPWIFFKENPFFNLVKLVHPYAGYCYRASSGRGSSNLRFSITADYIQQLKDNPKTKLFLLCGQFSQGSDNSDVNVEFPMPLEISFNGNQIQDNVKGLKNKPGTAKTADLTPYIKALPTDENFLEMVYAFTNVEYLYFCYIVHTNSPEDILGQILANPHIPTETTMSEFNAPDDEDEEEIKEMSSVLSLKCPLSYAKMKYPVKTIFCKHLTCFDALSFVQLQEQIPTWDCPICHQKVKLKELVISDYVLDIIKATDSNVESVELEANGGWNPVVESDDDLSDSDDDQSARPGAASKKSVEPEVITLDSDSDSDSEDEPVVVGASVDQNRVVALEDRDPENATPVSGGSVAQVASKADASGTTATFNDTVATNSNSGNSQSTTNQSSPAKDTATVTATNVTDNDSVNKRVINPLLPHSDRLNPPPSIAVPAASQNPLHKPPPPKFPPITTTSSSSSSAPSAPVNNAVTPTTSISSVVHMPPPPPVSGSSLIADSVCVTTTNTDSPAPSSSSNGNSSTDVSSLFERKTAAPPLLPIVTAAPPVLTSTASKVVMTPMMREMAEMEKIPVVVNTSTSVNANANANAKAPVPPPHRVISGSKSSLFPVVTSPSTGSISKSPTVNQFQPLPANSTSLFSTSNAAKQTNDQSSASGPILLPPNSKSSLLTDSQRTSPKNGREAQLNQIQALNQKIQASASAASSQPKGGASTNSPVSHNSTTATTTTSVSPPLVTGVSSIAASPEVIEVNTVNPHKVFNSWSNGDRATDDGRPVPPPHGQYNQQQNRTYGQPKQVAPPPTYSNNTQHQHNHHNQNQNKKNQHSNVYFPPNQSNQPYGYSNNSSNNHQSLNNAYHGNGYSDTTNNSSNYYSPNGNTNTNTNITTTKRAFSGDYGSGYSDGSHIQKKPAPVVIDLTLDSDDE